MTTTKRIGIAAGVLVLLAGSGFGLVHWEGRMWDERVARSGTGALKWDGARVPCSPSILRKA